ncbi:MAG: hypothetical protein ACFBSE_16740, partial [Prochloraceae cyanobacterium]
MKKQLLSAPNLTNKAVKSNKASNSQATNNQKKAKRSRSLKDLAPNILYNQRRNIVYVGCNLDRVEGYLHSFSTFYRCEDLTVREPEYIQGFDREIVIKDMQPYTDTYAQGLDTLVNGQIL